MKHSVYFADNSQETLDKLESLGFYICPCCKFHGAKWINLFLREIDEKTTKKEFHGTGYQCDDQCGGADNPDPKKCIRCSINENIAYKRNVHIFTDIDDMVKFINENDEQV